MFRFNFYWMYGLIFMMLVALYMTNDSSETKEIDWTEFQKLTKENVFDKMIVFNHKNIIEAPSNRTKSILSSRKRKISIHFHLRFSSKYLLPINLPISMTTPLPAIISTHRSALKKAMTPCGTFSSLSDQLSCSSLFGFSSCAGCREELATGLAMFLASENPEHNYSTKTMTRK